MFTRWPVWHSQSYLVISHKPNELGNFSCPAKLTLLLSTIIIGFNYSSSAKKYWCLLNVWCVSPLAVYSDIFHQCQLNACWLMMDNIHNIFIGYSMFHTENDKSLWYDLISFHFDFFNLIYSFQGTLFSAEHWSPRGPCITIFSLQVIYSNT